MTNRFYPVCPRWGKPVCFGLGEAFVIFELNVPQQPFARAETEAGATLSIKGTVGLCCVARCRVKPPLPGAKHLAPLAPILSA